MAPIDIIGLSAGFFTIAAFYCTRTVPLRMLAITANVLFLIYGASVGLVPVVILHVVLLPLNLLRLSQAVAGDRLPERLLGARARDLQRHGWPSQQGPWIPAAGSGARMVRGRRIDS